MNNNKYKKTLKNTSIGAMFPDGWTYSSQDLLEKLDSRDLPDVLDINKVRGQDMVLIGELVEEVKLVIGDPSSSDGEGQDIITWLRTESQINETQDGKIDVLELANENQTISDKISFEQTTTPGNITNINNKFNGVIGIGPDYPDVFNYVIGAGEDDDDFHVTKPLKFELNQDVEFNNDTLSKIPLTYEVLDSDNNELYKDSTSYIAHGKSDNPDDPFKEVIILRAYIEITQAMIDAAGGTLIFSPYLRTNAAVGANDLTAQALTSVARTNGYGAGVGSTNSIKIRGASTENDFTNLNEFINKVNDKTSNLDENGQVLNEPIEDKDIVPKDHVSVDEFGVFTVGQLGKYNIVSEDGILVDSGTQGTEQWYGITTLQNENLFMVGNSGSWAQITSKGETINNGTTGSQNWRSVTTLNNGNVFMVGFQGFWAILTKDGNIINEGRESSVSGWEVVTALNNGNAFLVGRSGNWAIFTEDGILVDSGTQGTAMYRGAATLNNGNVLIAGENGNWAILTEDGILVDSGIQVTAMWYEITILQNENAFMVGTNGNWAIFTEDGILVDSGTQGTLTWNTVTTLNNENAFMVGTNGNWAIFTEDGILVDEGRLSNVSGNINGSQPIKIRSLNWKEYVDENFYSETILFDDGGISNPNSTITLNDSILNYKQIAIIVGNEGRSQSIQSTLNVSLIKLAYDNYQSPNNITISVVGKVNDYWNGGIGSNDFRSLLRIQASTNSSYFYRIIGIK